MSSQTEPETVLVLRTCKADGSSDDGFVWPGAGRAVALNWHPSPGCGGGLQGLLRGEGDGDHIDWSYTARWLVVEVVAAEVVDLGGKCKFPRGTVVYCGDRQGATSLLAAHYPGAAVVGGTSTTGDHGTATSGDGGRSVSGDSGTSTSGNRGTSTSGYWGTSISGYGGTSTSGEDGTLVIAWCDSTGRRRLAVGYVGEDGILPGVAYRVRDGVFVAAEVAS